MQNRRETKTVSAGSNISPWRQKPFLHLEGNAMTIDPAEAKKQPSLWYSNCLPYLCFTLRKWKTGLAFTVCQEQVSKITFYNKSTKANLSALFLTLTMAFKETGLLHLSVCFRSFLLKYVLLHILCTDYASGLEAHHIVCKSQWVCFIVVKVNIK